MRKISDRIILLAFLLAVAIPSTVAEETNALGQLLPKLFNPSWAEQVGLSPDGSLARIETGANFPIGK